MSEESSSSPPPKKKVGVEPRSLPERFDEEAGDPFEQLNSDARPKEEPEKERGRTEISCNYLCSFVAFRF